MKTIIKQLMVIAILLSSALSTWAYSFVVDGIYYAERDVVNTVYVTYKDSNYNSYSGSVVIPSEVTYNGTTYRVVEIDRYAFRDCTGLTSVTIPNSVKFLGHYAFYGCTGLKSVTIPNSVSYIGSSAFHDCTGLTSITIPDSVTEMGDGVFGECRELTSVKLSNSLTAIESCVFYRCKSLSSISIPKSINRIGDGAFIGCFGLNKVEISDLEAWCNIKFEGNYTNPLYFAHNLYLNGTLVTEVVIPASVTKIGNYTFHGWSGLTSVTIHDKVTSIGDYAFQECTGLTSVTIPNQVTSIGRSAFEKCSSVSSLTIGSSVNTIGALAFDIARLGRIKVLNPVPPTCYDETVFASVSKANCLLIVPEGSSDDYSTTFVWWDFKRMQEDDGAVYAIGSDSLKITGESGEIRIAGADGAVAEVYSLSGALLYRGTDATIALPRGMYVVKVAGTTTKVIL